MWDMFALLSEGYVGVGEGATQRKCTRETHMCILYSPRAYFHRRFCRPSAVKKTAADQRQAALRHDHQWQTTFHSDQR